MIDIDSQLDTRVVGIYVDPRGPYPALLDEWYDERRDARSYVGCKPVVAHPPCGPWGKLRHMSKHDDPACGPHAVEVVRRVGGALEHPAESLLFRHCGMPHPGELPDDYGGMTFAVAQCDWGHVARKRSWIYIVGVQGLMIPAKPAAREPTHWIAGGRGRSGKKADQTPLPAGIKIASPEARRRSPPAFAKWLIEIAAAVAPEYLACDD
jgi:hypothetical protein